MPAAAAYADAVNWQVGVEEFAYKSRVLARLCESAGRDPASIRRTHAPNFQLFDSEREFARWRQDERRGMSGEDVHAYIRSRGALYGTAAAIEEHVGQFIDAGCGGFMAFCNSAPSVHRWSDSPRFHLCAARSKFLIRSMVAELSRRVRAEPAQPARPRPGPPRRRLGPGHLTRRPDAARSDKQRPPKAAPARRPSASEPTGCP